MGVLGAHDSAPVFVDWPLVYNVPRALLYAVPIVLLLRKPNRNLQAWMILAPPLFLYLVWGIVKQIEPFRPWCSDALGNLVATLVLILVLLWLLADKLTFHSRVPSLLATILLIVAASAAVPLCQDGWQDRYLREEALVSGGTFAVSALALLLGVFVAGRCCCKTYSDRRFMLWLPLWVILIGTLLGSFWAGLWLQMALQHLDYDEACRVPVYAAVLSSTAYVAFLPFLVLALRVPLYRSRLQIFVRTRASSAAGGENRRNGL
jgi:hypothetical protein